MKKLLLLITLFPIFISSQKDNHINKNRISINFFNPIQIPGNDKYFNDNWLIINYGGTAELPQKRTYTRIGFGVDYGFMLKNKNYLIVNFGLGYRKINESTNFRFPNPYNHPDEVVQGGTEIIYNQTNYNLSFLYQSSLKTDLFELNGAFGLSYLLQGIGKQQYVDWWTENVYPNAAADSNYSITNSKFSIGHNVGVTIRLGFNIQVYKNLKIGADISSYLFFSFYNPKSIHENSYYQRKTYDNGSGILNTEEYEGSSSTESFTNFKQFSFTNISPSLKITYEL